MTTGTTKTLYLIRHSKADYADQGLTDVERQLTPEGVRDSHLVAGKLLKAGITFDQIISSHAFRAMNTAVVFANVLDISFSKFKVSRKLYESKVSDYLSVVNEIDSEINVAAIFGHNETISEFATYLTGKILDFPTTTVIEIRIMSEWNECSGGIATFIRKF